MIIDFMRASPSGNNTILVLSPVPEGLKGAVFEKLMALYDSWAEQLGFVSFPPGCDAALHMAGGEFCGNASLSLAACLAELHGSENGILSLRVSGAAENVLCRIRKSGDSYIGRIEMPKPVEFYEAKLGLFGKNAAAFLLRFEGICHIILEKAYFEPEKIREPVFAEFLDEKARELGCKALGLIFSEPGSAGILPLIYVREGRTLFLEKSCASGTAAFASFLAFKNGAFSGDISQEGGTLRAEAVFSNGKITELYIENKIRLLKRESLDVNI